MHSDEITIRRILVAVDSAAEGLAALETATRLAAWLSAELAGLFVEDANLLRLASLPFAREVGFHSAAVRRLQPIDVERALRLKAARLERAVAQAAEEMNAEWSFRVVRGELLAQALAMATGMDLLVLGKGSGAIGPSPVRAGGLPSAAALGSGPVVVLYDGSQTAWRALAAALQLGVAHRHELLVVLAAHHTTAFPPLRAEVMHWLVERGAATARFLPLSTSDSVPLIERLCALRAATVVLPIGSPFTTPENLAALLTELFCPLVLVR